MNSSEFSWLEGVGKFPSEWKIMKIKEIGKVVTGSTPPTKDKEFYGNEFPFITAKDFKGHRYIEDTEKKLSRKGAEYLKSKQIPLHSVMVTCIGSEMGKVALTKAKISFTNQQINTIIPDEKVVNPLFLYYRLYPLGKWIKSLGSGRGSAKPILPKSSFEDIEIPIPPLPEQKKIAEVLGSLDDKIELNYEMNKTLEAIAQVIFKYWFIDFGPFQDDLIYNEELGKEIPKGWEVKPLRGFIDLKKGVSYKSENLITESDIGLVNLKCIRRGGGFKDEIKPYNGEFKREQVLQEGDIVIAITDLTRKGDVIGAPARIYQIERFKTLIASLDLVIVKIKNQKSLKPAFLYHLLLTHNARAYMKGYADGTTVLHLKPRDILDYQFVLPPSEYMNKFAEMAESIFQLTAVNFKEAHILEQIRDALLPKLLSGEIRVKVDIEEEFPRETKKLIEIKKEKARIRKTLLDYFEGA